VRSNGNDFGRALESLNTSFKIPDLEMVTGRKNPGERRIDHNLRRDLAGSMSSNQTYETRDIKF
jgi:hypothetical protein